MQGKAGTGTRTGARTAALAAGLLLGFAVSCIQFDPFACQDDSDCVFEGRPGQCRLAEQVCIYPDDSCPTRWGTAQGECMSPVGGGSEVGSEAGPGEASDAQPGTGTGSGSADSGTTLPPTTTSMVTTTATTTGPTTETGDPSVCGAGPFDDLTGLGVVWASSTYSDSFHAFLSTDGNFATSWFSAGPEPGGPSIYEWTVVDPVCITSINLTGNGLHQDPDFRTDYGFESVVIRVYDEDDSIVFQQMESLADTPDPPIIVEPDVWGVKIVLELSEHESDDCGGFSELTVVGL